MEKAFFRTLWQLRESVSESMSRKACLLIAARSGSSALREAARAKEGGPWAWKVPPMPAYLQLFSCCRKNLSWDSQRVGGEARYITFVRGLRSEEETERAGQGTAHAITRVGFSPLASR